MRSSLIKNICVWLVGLTALAFAIFAEWRDVYAQHLLADYGLKNIAHYQQRSNCPKDGNNYFDYDFYGEKKDTGQPMRGVICMSVFGSYHIIIAR